MSSSFVIDSTMQAAITALDGLGQRQNAISRNLANVDTPGYQAQTVNFEDTLKLALHAQNRLPMEVTDASHLTGVASTPTAFTLVNRPGGSQRADGNNVDLDVEMTDMAQAGITYQALTQAVTRKFDLLKTIASG
jgi:flagellar basal-body rod protein FlgB